MQLSFAISQKLNAPKPIEFIVELPSKQPVQKKVQPAVPSAKKTVSKPVPKPKTVPKKIEQPKKTVPKPSAKPKVVPKPAPQKQSKPEPKKEIAKKEPVPKDLNFDSGKQLGKHEQELLEEFNKLQEDIVTYWRPPSGFARDCSCVVKVVIDWQGGIDLCGIEKTSGVLIYDSAAQAALYQVAMPRWTWGKTLTLAFN